MSAEAIAPATPSDTGAHARQPLDEVMLAMDVVDTLRRRAHLVSRELDLAGREQDLEDRLRKIYQAQGIAVPDHILEAGVAALRENRFVYQPRSVGFAVALARIYVGRARWGKWLLGGIGVCAAAWTINYLVIVAPQGALPERLAAAHAESVALARSNEALERAERLSSAGQAALRNDDAGAARQALESLQALRATLDQEYSLRIVNRAGERSGVWRIPDVNTQARNYYIVVEAVDHAGRVLEVPITSEESGKTESVTAWGLRVDKQTFEQVGRDKQDDGIIQRDRFGYKERGDLTPRYDMRTTGGAITQW